MKKGVSVFSNPSDAYKKVENEVQRISVIGTAFASGELEKDNYKDAVRALNYAYSNLDKLMLDLGKELKGASMFAEATDEDSEIGTLVNNIALAKAAAELAANAIANDMGGVSNVDDALQIPEEEDEGEEEVEMTDEVDTEADETIPAGDDGEGEDGEMADEVDQPDEGGEEEEGEEEVEEAGDSKMKCGRKKTSMHSSGVEITPEQVKLALFGK